MFSLHTVIRSVLSAFLIAVAVLLLYGVYLWHILPNGEETRRLAYTTSFIVEKKNLGDKTLIALVGSEYQYGIRFRLDSISPYFVHAVIATEDHRFYSHGPAYMLYKFGEAAFVCVYTKVRMLLGDPSRRCAGGSTIPQQLARNLYIPEHRSVLRKFRELVWALKMEVELSKDEILEIYLNRIYLGNGLYGVESASRYYFNKPAKDLNLKEAAVLAASVRRPSVNCFDAPHEVAERAVLILKTMYRRGAVDRDEILHSRSLAIGHGRRQRPSPYVRHFFRWIAPAIARVLDTEPDGIYQVVSSLSPEAQVYAEHSLEDGVYRLRRKRVSQGALVSMRPDGAVIAMVGGVGDSVRTRGINRAKATDGLLPRPPASAFKPILYLTALEHGLTPKSKISASPVKVRLSPKEPWYHPKNVGGRVYRKPVTLTAGLVESINTAAVLLLERLGIGNVRATARRLGIAGRFLSSKWDLALGGSGIPLVDLTGAYSVFAAGGYQVKPYGIVAIYDIEGAPIYRHESPVKRIVRRRDIHALNSMLAQVVTRGTGTPAITHLSRKLKDGRHVAGKTGTGDEFTDAWFIGYTPELVTGIWLGNDTPKKMRNVYGSNAASVWNNYMRRMDRNMGIGFSDTPLP